MENASCSVQTKVTNQDWEATSQHISQEVALTRKDDELLDCSEEHGGTVAEHEGISNSNRNVDEELLRYLQPSYRDLWSYTGLLHCFLDMKMNKSKLKRACGAGTDGVTIEDFEMDLVKNLIWISDDLVKGSYMPMTLKCIQIPKANGKMRTLSLPCTRDKIVQRRIVELLDPIWENIFSDKSCAYRKRQSSHKAVAWVWKYLQDDLTYVVDADIKGYFDNVDHDLLLEMIRKRVDDTRIIELIDKFLKVGKIDGRKVTERNMLGIPQGGSMSPFLANVYLHEVDMALEENGLSHVRYADDIVIFCSNETEANNALEFLDRHISNLKLTLSKEKTHVFDIRNEGLDYVGYHISPEGLSISSRNYEKFRMTIRKISKWTGFGEDPYFVRLNEFINGIRGHFRYMDQDQLEKLDHMIASRVRKAVRKHFITNEGLEAWQNTEQEAVYEKSLALINDLASGHQDISSVSIIDGMKLMD